MQRPGITCHTEGDDDPIFKCKSFEGDDDPIFKCKSLEGGDSSKLYVSLNYVVIL